MERKIAVLGTEKVIFGMQIAGFSRETNIFYIFEQDFDEEELITSFKELISREDIGLIFICDNLYKILENDISGHKKALPSILKIPTWS